MCTELFLAIIYFSTIFAVNFFLFKLLKTYTNRIMYLLKIQNIFKQKNIQLARAFTILHLYAKKDRKNINLLPLLNVGEKEEDILTIGNTYVFLLKNFSNRDSKNEINNFYFELLENQYLSKDVEFVKKLN